MHTFRVTKYDPTLRDPAGAYLPDDWTSFSDIGRSFNGVELTRQEYERVEQSYIEVASSYLKESGNHPLTIKGVEAHKSKAPRAGSVVVADTIGPVLRDLLREEYWCRLEGRSGYVHVGYDYYMYIGVAVPCPRSEALASELGLFVEKCPSPYIE